MLISEESLEIGDEPGRLVEGFIARKTSTLTRLRAEYDRAGAAVTLQRKHTFS